MKLFLIVLFLAEAHSQCIYVKVVEGVQADELTDYQVDASSGVSDCEALCEASPDGCTSYAAVANGDCNLYAGIDETVEIMKSHSTFDYYEKVCTLDEYRNVCAFELHTTKADVSNPDSIGVPNVRDFTNRKRFSRNFNIFRKGHVKNNNGKTIRQSIPSLVNCEKFAMKRNYNAYSAREGAGYCMAYQTIQNAPASDPSATPTSLNYHELMEKQCNLVDISPDCTYGAWGTWTACNPSCGAGTQSHSRSLTAGDPALCVDLSQTQACNDGCCPVDCVLSAWAFGACSVTCGGGTQTSSRTVVTQASCNGAACGTLSGSQACNDHDCDEDCAYSSFGAFGTCVALVNGCGAGVKTRTRTITTQSSGNGVACNPSTLEESQSCDAGCCPVDCVTSAWGAFDGCNAPCDGGTQTHTRTVVTQASCNGNPCGDLSESQACNTHLCDVDCVVGAWTAWSACDASCGTGSQSRTRAVTTPVVGDGAPCPELGGTQVCDSGVSCNWATGATGVAVSTDLSSDHEVYPDSTDCQADCDAHTAFECKAYIWAGDDDGDGTYCHVYGEITGTVTRMEGSPFDLYIKADDQGAIPTFNYCCYKLMASGKQLAEEDTVIEMWAPLMANCQAFCRANVAFATEPLAPTCGSFAWKPYDIGKNCVLYPGTKAAADFEDGGDYDVRQYYCTDTATEPL